MALHETEAIVLHAFEYMESSRILRLLTREGNVQSALARGVRRAKGKHGSALDLFAQGTAQLYVKPQRDLHNLASFEVERSRAALARDVGRFTAASAIAELVLHFVGDEESHNLFEIVEHALDTIAVSAPEDTITAGLAGCWRVVSGLGFTPVLEHCSTCHTALPLDTHAYFCMESGGSLCRTCAPSASFKRMLPDLARIAIHRWLETGDPGRLGDVEARAHQRLLREFLGEHLVDARPLRAFAVWEMERWSSV